LRLLAAMQGTKVDDWRDEQPGKILHELRIGELARIGAIPHTPYYGTVDATPLFLVLLAQYVAWTGDMSLFGELRGNVDRALEWLDRWADSNGDGFVDYQSEQGHGLVNQGWKDSGDGIIDAHGHIARPPIALAEVQGYVFLARHGIADLLEHAGENDAAADQRRRADELRERFEREFWSERLGTYILARQRDGKPCDVVASNAGQVLWSGIASAEHARRTADRLLRDDMYDGWGIRTLSSEAVAYNPIGYHLGTVWPHDNGIIAAGLHRYGYDRHVRRLFTAMLETAADFPHFRLPECFAGYGRREFGLPVRYPVACHPQAWAAGSIPHLLTTSLGLEPDALSGRLRIVRPLLPHFVDSLEVRGLRVGDGRADLRYSTTGHGDVAVEVVRSTGVEVEVEGGGSGTGSARREHEAPTSSWMARSSSTVARDGRTTHPRAASRKAAAAGS
jgi:glycogen debranching enzyme